jgi:copper chaperone CopZ
MKRSIALLAVLWLIVTASSVLAGAGGATLRTTLQIEGMHCDGCSATIKGTLERTEGVMFADADHEEGTAVVVHDSKKVSAEDLKVAIERLGYKVTGFESTVVDESTGVRQSAVADCEAGTRLS